MRIPIGSDVQRLYDVSVMSLWDKMRHPKLHAFENICLKHFSNEALQQPHFVESYLPSVGKVKILYHPQVMYHLNIYQSKLMPFMTYWLTYAMLGRKFVSQDKSMLAKLVQPPRKEPIAEMVPCLY